MKHARRPDGGCVAVFAKSFGSGEGLLPESRVVVVSQSFVA